MKITSAVIAPIPPSSPKIAPVKPPIHTPAGNQSAINNNLLILLTSLLDKSITLPTLNGQSAPQTTALMQHLLQWFKQWEKPTNATQSKMRLEQFMQFQALQLTATTPMAHSFNGLLGALLMARLSPEAGKWLKQRAKIPESLIKELGQNNELSQSIQGILKSLTHLGSAAQMSSMTDGNPPTPIYINIPMPQEQQLKRVELKIEQQEATTTREGAWHLKMLLPVKQQSVLADIYFYAQKPPTISFYCPDNFWLTKVKHYSTALSERLNELGINECHVTSQLGNIPQTLLPTPQGQLDIKV